MVKSGTPVEFKPLSEKCPQVRRILPRLYGGQRVTLRDVLKILDPRGFLRELKVEVVQGGLEGHIAHLRAEHVKKHGAFVHHDRAIVRE